MDFALRFKYCPVCGSSNFELNNIKSKRCQQCSFVWYMNASAAVAAFIRNSQGHLLVCRRAKDPAKGTLDLPGGFVDDNETAEMAVAREINEELGSRVTASRYLFSLPNVYQYSGLNIPTLDLFFECELDNTTSLLASDDVEECFFVPMNKLEPELFGLQSIRKSIYAYKQITDAKDI